MLTEHPEVKSFICPDCNLTLRSQVILELHQEIVHNPQINLDEKPYPCPYCGHTFKMGLGDRGNLWKHVEGD